MNDPLYQALISEETLETVIRDGHGLLMPGFEKTLYSGMTDEEIAAMAADMKHYWGDPAKAGSDLPSYAQSPGSGDPAKGRATFATYCGSCHGDSGEGKADGAGSVVDIMYLRLVSDQALRSTVICGRLDLGCPSFRGPYPGQPEGRGLSVGEIDDVTAWLISNRISIAEEAAQ
jgi:cytochrome c oxidase cbb3-type subunit 3/ubiquinol-cytochrome c reductase cytochrome c subunit